ncbi:Vitamin B12-binding protein [bacterium HR37]|nr:Vitamin B12-binding protein [bacterium HR37]
MRIVSLCPSNTEILFAIGAGKYVVGVDSYSDYPPQVRELPKVGPDLKVNVDKIKALSPDLVVASLSVPGMERNIEKLSNHNIPFVVLNPQSIEEILNDIVFLGSITKTLERAKSVVDKMRLEIESVMEKVKWVDYKPRVYWEWWPKPLIAACGLGWINEMIETVRGVNVFSGVKKTSAVVSDTDILTLDPEVVVVCWCGPRWQRKMRREVILTRSGWEAISGIRSKRVYCVSEALFGRPGPRITDGLNLLLELIHPEVCRDGMQGKV